MKRLVMLVMLLVPGLSWAADETVWALSETKSTRFADRDVAGPTFKSGAKLEVLVREGDRLRVHEGDDFGWISVAATTSMPPPDETAFDPAALRERLKALGLDGQMPGMPGGPNGMPVVPSPVPTTAPPVPAPGK